MLPVGPVRRAGSDWYVPNQLIFARSHRDWDAIADDLPQHATYRQTGDRHVTCSLRRPGRPPSAAARRGTASSKRRCSAASASCSTATWLSAPRPRATLLVRVDPDKQDEALARPGAFADAHGRARDDRLYRRRPPMALSDDDALKGWIDYAMQLRRRRLPAEMKVRIETMDHLAERIRMILGGDPRITEKTMFGGLTFLLNGHILVGCKKDGRILLSVGKEQQRGGARAPRRHAR